MVGTKSFWRQVEVPQIETVESTIEILSTFAVNSNHSLKSVVINSKFSEKDLRKVFNILIKSNRSLSILHITQDPTANLHTRNLVRKFFHAVEVLSTVEHSYGGHFVDNWGEMEEESDSDPFLRGLYVDELKLVTSEDLDWMDGLQNLKVRKTDDLSALYRILVHLKSSLEDIDLGGYDFIDRLDQLDQVPDLQEHIFPLVWMMELPILFSRALLSNWKFPSLCILDSDSVTLCELSELSPDLLNSITALTLNLTVTIEEFSEVEDLELDEPFKPYLDVFEVSQALAVCPNLRCLQIRFATISETTFDIEELLYSINEKVSGSVPCPLLQELTFFDDFNLDRLTMVKLLEFESFRIEMLKKEHKIEIKTRKDTQRERDGETTHLKFKFEFYNEKTNTEFEKMKKEIEMEMKERETRNLKV